MTDIPARETIMATIRRSLGAAQVETDRGSVMQRLDDPPRGPIPARARIAHHAQVALFMEMAARVNASVERIKSDEDLPGRIAAFLRSHNLPQSVVLGTDPWLAALPWDKQPALERRPGRAHGDEQTGLSHAFAGVAETGTLVLASGPDSPVTVNFLPETHIVAVQVDDIAGDYETALARIRRRYGKGAMPRAVNMITGPSRSADIQQTLLLGAHGPRRLHIIVVG